MTQSNVSLAFFYPETESGSRVGTLFNRLAAWWTSHKPHYKNFSHCELIFNNGHTFTIRRGSKLSMVIKNYESNYNYGFVDIVMERDKYERLYAFCCRKATEEMEFDQWGSIFNFLLCPPFDWLCGLPIKYDNKTFCSKIVAEAFIDCGIFDDKCEPSLVSPNHVWTYLVDPDSKIKSEDVIVCTGSAPRRIN